MMRDFVRWLARWFLILALQAVANLMLGVVSFAQWLLRAIHEGILSDLMSSEEDEP